MLSAVVGDEAMLLRSPVQNRFGGSTCPLLSLSATNYLLFPVVQEDRRPRNTAGSRVNPSERGCVTGGAASAVCSWELRSRGRWFGVDAKFSQ